MRRARLVFVGMGVLVLLFGPMGHGADAQEGPSVTVTPSTELTDGQTVSVTASGFFATNDPRIGTIVPSAHQCPAGLFPASGVTPLDPDFAAQVLQVLNESCGSLGSFPVASPTTRTVTVHTTVTTPSGGTLRCGVSTADCAIVVIGLTNSANLGVASAPISFRPATPGSKADCKSGGWRNLATAQGQPFRDQGQCVSYVVARPS